MKKESFEILADLFAKANAIEAREGEASIEVKTVVEYLSRITIIEMINEKVGKLNLWDFVDQDKTRIANMIFHRDGFMLASNRRMLLKIKREYTPELEGKGIHKNGTIESRTPLSSFDTSLSSALERHECGAKVLTFDFEKFATIASECKAIRKMSRNTIRPIVSLDGGSVRFYYDELLPAVQFMIDMGIEEISIVPNSGVPALIRKDENVCLVMPITGDTRQMANVLEM